MKYLALLFILAFTTFSAKAQLSNGLVAHWNYNGNVNDASGKGHNGTAYNISYTQGKNGVANNAAVFNGTSSWVNVPHSDSFNISEYSICAIIKPTGFYTNTCQGNFVLFRGGQYVSGGYGLQYNDNIYNSCTAVDTNKFVFLAEVGASSNSLAQWQTTTRVHTQQWYCVVATYNQITANTGTIKMYINGTLTNTVNITGKLTNITAALTMGKYIYFTNQWQYWLNAVVDDVRLYDRVLSTTEISSYCNTVSVPDTSINLVSLSDSIYCGESLVTANYTVNYNYGTGNAFTLQLSDATGSFASAINVGSSSSTTSGTVTGNLPGNLTPGNYKLRIVSSNPMKTSNIKGIVLATPVALTASISANPGINVLPLTPITFTATVPTGIISPNYQWMKNGVTIPGATSNTYTGTSAVNLLDGDNIHVSLSATQYCSFPSLINSDTLTLGVELSVHSVKNNKSINVYPNPNNGTFTIKGLVNANKVQVQIINAVGQTVYRADIPASNGVLNKTIELNDMPSGIYQIRLKSGKEASVIPLHIM